MVVEEVVVVVDRSYQQVQTAEDHVGQDEVREVHLEVEAPFHRQDDHPFCHSLSYSRDCRDPMIGHDHRDGKKNKPKFHRLFVHRGGNRDGDRDDGDGRREPGRQSPRRTKWH